MILMFFFLILKLSNESAIQIILLSFLVLYLI